MIYGSSHLLKDDYKEETRLDRAKQIKNTVMEVSEGVFCVPSQNRAKKAHIVTVEEEEYYVEIPNSLLTEAKEISNISNCSCRSEEYAIKVRNFVRTIASFENIGEPIKNYSCTCPDFVERIQKGYGPIGEKYCKHILAVKLNQKEVI